MKLSGRERGNERECKEKRGRKEMGRNHSKRQQWEEKRRLGKESEREGRKGKYMWGKNKINDAGKGGMSTMKGSGAEGRREGRIFPIFCMSMWRPLLNTTHLSLVS